MLCYYDDPKPPSPLGWWDSDWFQTAINDDDDNGDDDDDEDVFG